MVAMVSTYAFFEEMEILRYFKYFVNGIEL